MPTDCLKVTKQLPQCRDESPSLCQCLAIFLVAAALVFLPAVTLAAGFFGNEVVGAKITASNGQEVAIVVPRAYSDSTSQTRLIGGSHPGSLSRESLRQQRYEQALRRLIYQPDLPRETFAASAATTMRALGVSQQVAEAAQTAFLVVPELIDEDYVFAAAGGGELAKQLKPLVGQIATQDSHLAHLVAAAPAVLQGAALVNDFMLYKAMATDMAELRLTRLTSLLEQTEAVGDPALVAALDTVRRELDAMRNGRFWSSALETLRRNQSRLIGTAGRSIMGASLKAIGTSNPGLLAFSGTLWGIDRLGDHIESIQQSILVATLGWRMESIAGTSGDPEAQALLAYAKAAFSDNLLDAINNPLARFRDVLTPGSNESQMRLHYGELRSHYLEAVEFWLVRWEEPLAVARQTPESGTASSPGDEVAAVPPGTQTVPSPEAVTGSCDADLERIRTWQSVTIWESNQARQFEFQEYLGGEHVEGAPALRRLESVSHLLPGAERYLLASVWEGGASGASFIDQVIRCSNGVLETEFITRGGMSLMEDCLQVGQNVAMRDDANCCPSLRVTYCLYSVNGGIGQGDPHPKVFSREEEFQFHFGNNALPPAQRFIPAGEYAPLDYGPTHSSRDRFRLYPDGAFAAWEASHPPENRWSFGIWSVVRNEISGQHELVMLWAEDRNRRQFRFPLWQTADGADLVRQARHHRYAFSRLGDVPSMETALGSCHALPCRIQNQNRKMAEPR